MTQIVRSWPGLPVFRAIRVRPLSGAFLPRVAAQRDIREVPI
jgi:hypothetical protein